MIEHAIPAADRTTISERSGEIEQLIAIAEARLARLRPLAERSVVPQSQIIDAETELAGPQARGAILIRETRIAPEVLRAPIDGVIAASRVVAGQVVQAQDLLFQIVDPASLWVEAFDYGEIDPATLKEATAVGAEQADDARLSRLEPGAAAASHHRAIRDRRSAALDPRRPAGHGDRQEKRFQSPA